MSGEQKRFKTLISIGQTRKILAYSFLLLLLLNSATWADAENNIERRLFLGLSFFPNVIAVDLDILTKRTASGKLQLLLVYKDDLFAAEKLANLLSKKVHTIRKNPVEIKISNDPTKNFSPSNRPCGIFLAEWLPDEEFKKIINFAVEQHLIVFSPLLGDVERGATAGLYISSQIRPSINISTLKNSGIRINQAFKELSKHYE